MTTRCWSPYQLAIFEAVQDIHAGSIVVIARAGSGKTTTLIESAYQAPIRGRMGIVAFARRSKQRVEDAEPPVHFEISTLHSMGLSLLKQHSRNLKVDNEGKKLRDLVTAEFPSDRGKRDLLFPLVKAAKTRLVRTPEAIRSLALDLDNDGAIRSMTELDDVVKATEGVLFMAREQDELIDFDDMIWLPVELGLSAARFRFLFVDELQDMTRAQLTLVASMCTSGRVVGFGDPAQAVYQFAGADADAVAELGALMKARTMPLSISYRCPLSVIAEAQELVPDIEPRDDAPDGKVVERGNLHSARPGDLIISRTNAPLLRQALEYVQRGVPAYIAGKEHGHEMTRIIARSNCDTVSSFVRHLELWAKGERQKLEAASKPTDRVDDRLACFSAIANGSRSLADMNKKIDVLFTERRGDAVVLSTVHQMKGEEFDRVFMLTDTFRIKREDWSDPERRGSEEANLVYVAITRSKNELHYVEGIR